MRLNEYRKRADEMHDPEAYQRANHFIRLLRDYRGRLTEQQIKTLRGQALKGDLEGAHRRLMKLSGREHIDTTRAYTAAPDGLRQHNER